MFLEFFEEFILWTIYFVSYNFKKQQYENKILNKLNIIFYIVWGSIQIIFIFVFLVILKLFYSGPLVVSENLLSAFAVIGLICFVLLYIKQIWLFFSIQKPLFSVIEKNRFITKLIIFGVFAFIPMIGYFTTMTFYFLAENQLRNKGFEIKIVSKKN